MTEIRNSKTMFCGLEPVSYNWFFVALVAEIFGLTGFEGEDIMQYNYRRRLMIK